MKRHISEKCMSRYVPGENAILYLYINEMVASSRCNFIFIRNSPATNSSNFVFRMHFQPFSISFTSQMNEWNMEYSICIKIIPKIHCSLFTVHMFIHIIYKQNAKIK